MNKQSEMIEKLSKDIAQFYIQKIDSIGAPSTEGRLNLFIANWFLDNNLEVVNMKKAWLYQNDKALTLLRQGLTDAKQGNFSKE